MCVRTSRGSTKRVYHGLSMCDSWVDVGVGASHHNQESRAKVDLQEHVDMGQEHDGLDHDRLLLQHSRTCSPPHTPIGVRLSDRQ
jgi:hypothetical protein